MKESRDHFQADFDPEIAILPFRDHFEGFFDPEMKGIPEVLPHVFLTGHQAGVGVNGIGKG